MPTLTDHMRRCELHHLPEAEARAAFRAFITGGAAPGVVAFPGTVAAVSNISILVPHHFMGREAAPADIEAAMARYRGRVAITAVHGMRGVGKRRSSRSPTPRSIAPITAPPGG